jgi:hypothetical protein
MLTKVVVSVSGHLIVGPVRLLAEAHAGSNQLN